MTTKPRTASPAGRRIGLLAVATSLVATAALLLSPTGNAAPSQFSGDELSAVSQAVKRSGVEGIAWYVDGTADRVVVTADSTVSTSEVAAIKRSVDTNSAALRFEQTVGVFRPLLSRGDAIYGTRVRCSLGFNVVKGSRYYFLTAGHCGKASKNWYANARRTTLIGPTIDYSFPSDDYALVRYDNRSLSHPGGFTAARAFVGEQVKRTGSTTGTYSGKVTALNVSVRYVGGGRVDGLIQTNICAEPGDSGGPLYDGTKALGLTSGGAGDCPGGGPTFYQPVTEAANVYGVTVY